MADQARILLFHEDLATSEIVRARLAKAGFEVTCARNFLDAVPHLAAGRSNLLLVYLPETEFVRNAFLSEARQAAPSLPIVAMAASVTEELRPLLARLGVATVLMTKTKWDDVLRTIREALAGPSAAGRQA